MNTYRVATLHLADPDPAIATSLTSYITFNAKNPPFFFGVSLSSPSSRTPIHQSNLTHFRREPYFSPIFDDLPYEYLFAPVFDWTVFGLLRLPQRLSHEIMKFTMGSQFLQFHHIFGNRFLIKIHF
jgi:hypothetical protein